MSRNVRAALDRGLRPLSHRDARCPYTYMLETTPVASLKSASRLDQIQPCGLEAISLFARAHRCRGAVGQADPCAYSGQALAFYEPPDMTTLKTDI